MPGMPSTESASDSGAALGSSFMLIAPSDTA